MKPLDVKTKFYNAESDEVFLEAQVQNITQSTITMDKVALEPSATFTVTNVTGDHSDNAGLIAQGECLQVGDDDDCHYLDEHILHFSPGTAGSICFV